MKFFLSLLVACGVAADWKVSWRPGVDKGVAPVVSNSLRLTLGQNFYIQGKVYTDLKVDELCKIKISTVFSF